MVVKERFRDWNLYHKSIVVGLAACVLWIVVWAVIVIDGAFDFEREEVLPYSAEAIWPWVIADENRPRWTTELIDIGELTGEAGEADTTRLLFWRRKFKRWQAVERVANALPQRLVSYVQESDIDQRWFTVELVPVSACATQVVMKEVIFPLEYAKRFWYFRETEAAENRLAEAHRALGEWVKSENPTCTTP
ncbi:MAG: hypothetical protein AB3N28_02260 [Kordiimonas sp.]